MTTETRIAKLVTFGEGGDSEHRAAGHDVREAKP